MNEQLIILMNTHNVSFVQKVKGGTNKIRKTCIGGGLANFLDDTVNISHVQDMLNDLDNFIQNSGTTDNLNDVLQSEDGYSAWLDQANVDIYGDLPDDDSTILQSVPIQEFQTLLEAWKNFLEE